MRGRVSWVTRVTGHKIWPTVSSDSDNIFHFAVNTCTYFLMFWDWNTLFLSFHYPAVICMAWSSWRTSCTRQRWRQRVHPDLGLMPPWWFRPRANGRAACITCITNSVISRCDRAQLQRQQQQQRGYRQSDGESTSYDRNQRRNHVVRVGQTSLLVASPAAWRHRLIISPGTNHSMHCGQDYRD